MEREGKRVGGGWSHSAWMEEGEVDWLGDPVERLARAAGRPTTGFKKSCCVCVCVCVCVLNGGKTRVFPSIFL